MRNLGPIFLGIGLFLIALGLLQHFLNLVHIDHLAIVLAVLGVISLIPGTVFMLQDH